MIHNLCIVNEMCPVKVKGPVKENEEEVETSSFIPEKLSQSLEETRLEQSLECNVKWEYMDFGSVPFNEFRTQCLGASAFPSLFPYE